MAKVWSFPRASKQYQQIAHALDTMTADELQAQVARWTGQDAAKAARNQLAVLDTLMKVAEERGRRNPVPSLGDTILIQQAHKLEQFADRTYPLSDKQVATVIRDVEGWRHDPHTRELLKMVRES